MNIPFKKILGRKIAMTQIFDSQGLAQPATIIEAGPCRVLAVRTRDKNGYSAVQVGFGSRSSKHAPKALMKQMELSGTDVLPAKIEEIRLRDDTHGLKIGDVFTIDQMFSPGDYVDVRGISRGHGFAGGVKRWNFRGGPASHGQSDRERAPGSLAARRSLGRVLPGKKMAGHYGVEKTTVQHMEVLRVDAAQNRLYVKGGVPGAPKSLVCIFETVKPRKKKTVVQVTASAKKKAVAVKAPAKK